MPRPSRAAQSAAKHSPGSRLPTWLRLLAGAIVVVFLLGVWAELRPPARGPGAGLRNLLLVTFDTTRADRIGCYGHVEAKTPNLDRLAQEGVLFERCMAVAPVTLPSHASILTGLYPFRHGARNNGTHQLEDQVVTLAERLREEGFATGAVISALVLDSRWGLDQGFDSYDDDLANAAKAPLFMFRETTAADTSRRARRWLQDRGEERFFLWVHFFDPHANYEPPEPIARRFPTTPEGRYDGEIHYADAGLGELLETLRLRGDLEETLVVMTSDHGESLGEHGESTHSLFVYDATTHVPLLFRHPALVAGKRVPDVVSGVDIVPTVLDLLGSEVPHDSDGHSLAEVLLLERSSPAPRLAYSEAMNPYYNHGWSDLRTVRDNAWRYIRAPRPELYDLRRDGRERSNLHDTHPQTARGLAEALAGLLAAGEVDTRGDDIRSMDPATREALAELGYVWTSEVEERNPEVPLRDPKDGVHLQERAQRAKELVRAERYEQAEALLRQVVAEDPDSILSLGTLAAVLDQLGRGNEAREILRGLVQRPAPRVGSFLRLAGLERKLGVEGWHTHVEAAKRVHPRDPMPWVREGDWAQEDGDAVAALAAYERAIAIDPACAKAWIGLGNTRHRLGEDQEAERVLRKAIALDPIAFEAHYNLGVVLESRQRPEEALDHYRRAQQLEPTHALTLVNLGNVHLAAGRVQEAEAAYRLAVGVAPDDFAAYYNFGILLLRTGRAGEAADAFERACAIEPARPEGWSLRVAACRAARRDGEMRSAAARLLELRPEDLRALLALSIAAERLGQPDDAESYLQKALRSDPEGVQRRAEEDAEVRAVLERLAEIRE